VTVKVLPSLLLPSLFLHLVGSLVTYPLSACNVFGNCMVSANLDLGLCILDKVISFVTYPLQFVWSTCSNIVVPFVTLAVTFLVTTLSWPVSWLVTALYWFVFYLVTLLSIVWLLISTLFSIPFIGECCVLFIWLTLFVPLGYVLIWNLKSGYSDWLNNYAASIISTTTAENFKRPRLSLHVVWSNLNVLHRVLFLLHLPFYFVLVMLLNDDNFLQFHDCIINNTGLSKKKG